MATLTLPAASQAEDFGPTCDHLLKVLQQTHRSSSSWFQDEETRLTKLKQLPNTTELISDRGRFELEGSNLPRDAGSTLLRLTTGSPVEVPGPGFSFISDSNTTLETPFSQTFVITPSPQIKQFQASATVLHLLKAIILTNKAICLYDMALNRSQRLPGLFSNEWLEDEKVIQFVFSCHFPPFGFSL